MNINIFCLIFIPIWIIVFFLIFLPLIIPLRGVARLIKSLIAERIEKAARLIKSLTCMIADRIDKRNERIEKAARQSERVRRYGPHLPLEERRKRYDI